MPFHPHFTRRPVYCIFFCPPLTNIHSSIRRRGPHSCMINLLLMQKACTAHRRCPRRNDATDSFWGQNNQNVHQSRRCERLEMRVEVFIFFLFFFPLRNIISLFIYWFLCRRAPGPRQAVHSFLPLQKASHGLRRERRRWISSARLLRSLQWSSLERPRHSSVNSSLAASWNLF